MIQKQCPLECCLATNPGVQDISIDEIPNYLRKKIKSQTIKRCLYCGTIWVEEINSYTKGFYVNKVILGTRDIHKDKTNWNLK